MSINVSIIHSSSSIVSKNKSFALYVVDGVENAVEKSSVIESIAGCYQVYLMDYKKSVRLAFSTYMCWITALCDVNKQMIMGYRYLLQST